MVRPVLEEPDHAVASCPRLDGTIRLSEADPETGPDGTANVFRALSIIPANSRV